ncbi:MAG: ribosome recycling factor [Clostridiales bacterium]|nr:ribosome recycling factor [Clostridiales bacterium]
MIDNEKVEELFLVLEDKLDKTVSVLSEEFTSIRAGRANPHVLDKLQVEAYGGMSPLNQLGNVAVSDARCLVISPWDKSLLKSIEKAILTSNLGLNPANDGNVIRLVFPELTEERRRDLVKQVKKMGEDSKVAVRNVRREAMEGIKKMKTGKELSEDEASSCEADIEKQIAKSIESVDKLVAAKEKELMTI